MTYVIRRLGHRFQVYMYDETGACFDVLPPDGTSDEAAKRAKRYMKMRRNSARFQT